MQLLDNLLFIEKLDKGGILASIAGLTDQMKQGWEEVGKIKFPSEFKEVNNIAVAGMGGSALGARIIDSLSADRLRVPLTIATDYVLPYFVNSKTLVVVSSYSGNTEETVNAVHDAIKKSAQIFVVTAGGKLAEISKENNLTSYIFDPIHNKSGQPRMGLGYSISAILSLFVKSSLLEVSYSEVEKAVETADKFIQEFGPRIPEEKNIAKMLATKIFNRGIALLASEHLLGVAHAFRNQVNENSKTFTALYKISEANHHLLEGLKNPPKLRESLVFLLIESPNYFERIKKRYPITEDVISKNGYRTLTYKTTSKTKIEEVMEILVLGSYVSFYLACLAGIDPSPIPWVDYFKSKMI